MNNKITQTKDKLKSIFSNIERVLSPYAKIAIGTSIVAALSVLSYVAFTEKSDITSSTVMITNLGETSGGSGVIISTEPNKSTVLTNGHVCEVVKNGGLVITTNGLKHVVVSYKQSQRHDLCLLTVASKLSSKVTIASNTPPMYEKAIVSGHPALLPNVVTEGHFSGNKIVAIFMGFQSCTEADKKDEQLEFLCLFFGGLPIVKTYETVLVTATIMPGSSGSAIYNSSKELAALVFAGSGGIGYAFAVPYEYIVRFLYHESGFLADIYPNYITDPRSLIRTNITNSRNLELKEKCNTGILDIEDSNHRRIIQNICGTFIRDTDWRK